MVGCSFPEPVLKELSTKMRCGILTNARGEILILHDQETASPIQWVEFDDMDNSFSLIHENGSIQPLGIELDNKARQNLLRARMVQMALLIDGKITATETITLIVKSVT